MSDVVVDTNVPIVANDRDGEYTIDCAKKCIERLQEARKDDRIVLDFAGSVLEEYKRYPRSSGQPGPGDAFYFHVLRHLGDGVRTFLVDLEDHHERVYAHFPADPQLTAFDPSDRKFAAAAIVADAVVLNATDSDWLTHRTALRDNGVVVEFVCGEGAATRGAP